MAKNLVVVESPAKAATIKKYLGKDFVVLASYGHVRDLVPKSGAVDPTKDFAMQYAPIKKSAARVTAIADAVKQAKTLYLATDPDREGEAIAWHLCELLRKQRVLKEQTVHRIAFHEITKTAVQEAVRNPRELAMNLVDAQQARRALDYLVGFNLSPLLWKKIRYGLSAGRVQSPALRMIVSREEEIERFVQQEYWTITADNQFAQQNFRSKLIEYRGEKLTQFSVTQQEQAEAIRDELRSLAAGKFRVARVEKKRRARKPFPPFTTSTLQQDASRKLNFSAKRTMGVAQKLYEAGYITYMRTDSVNLAQEAVEELRRTITQQFGEHYLPAKPNLYRTKSKSAQEAHEAIRPTHPQTLPVELNKKLPIEQARLYELIWQRTIACQMIPAALDVVVVDLSCGSNNLFRATGSMVVDPGFLAVYREGQDGNDKNDKAAAEDEKMLPPMQVGDEVALLDLQSNQHFTEPPPRYSEATLVKALEEYGIGRPSTYASIIDTLLSREYALLENRRFKPTDVGRVVNKFLSDYFTPYVDYQFTAQLEDRLDEIAQGHEQFLGLLREFWGPFERQVEEIGAKVQRADVTQEQLTEQCPKCGKPLMARLGKRGKFVGCSGYPECDYTTDLGGAAVVKEPEIVADRVCPQCGSALQIKVGRYGKFISCAGYPKCRYIEPLEKPQDTGVKCPVCGKGSLVKRKSRYGKYFYSCSQYPDCKYATWNEPIKESCPKCGWPILTLKTTKRRGDEKVCPQKECGYSCAVDK